MSDLATALKKVEALVSRYAEVSDYPLDPDEVVVKNILQGLARNWVRYGRPYCPCREVSGIAEKDRRNRCPCATHREDIARDGVCECGLFVSSAYLKDKEAG